MDMNSSKASNPNLHFSPDKYLSSKPRRTRSLRTMIVPSSPGLPTEKFIADLLTTNLPPITSSKIIKNNLLKISSRRTYSKNEEKKPPDSPDYLKEEKIVSPSNFIDHYYTNSSTTNFVNRVALPGDWNYNSKLYKDKNRRIELEEELKRSKRPNAAEEKNLQAVLQNSIKSAGNVASMSVYLMNVLNERSLQSNRLRRLKEGPLTYHWLRPESTGSSPESRESSTLVNISGTLLLFGGQSMTKLNSLYSWKQNHWEKLVTFNNPEARIGHSAVAYGNKMVVFGGWNSHKTGKRQCSSSLIAFDLKKLMWKQVLTSGENPINRRNHACCAFGKSMVIFGGLDSSSQVLGGLFTLDMETCEWVKPNLINKNKPCPRSSASLTSAFPPEIRYNKTVNLNSAVLDKPELSFGIYLFGGLATNGQVLGDLWVLQAYEDMYEWVEVQAEGNPIPRYGHTATYVNEVIVIFGGRNDESRHFLVNLSIFSLSSLKWEHPIIRDQGPGPRWSHAAECYGNQVLILGGLNYQNFVSAQPFILETDQTIVKRVRD